MLLLTPQRLQKPQLREQSPGNRRSSLEVALAQLVSRSLPHQTLGKLALQEDRLIAPQAVLRSVSPLLKVVALLEEFEVIAPVVAVLEVLALLEEVEVAPLQAVVALLEEEATVVGLLVEVQLEVRRFPRLRMIRDLPRGVGTGCKCISTGPAVNQAWYLVEV